MKTCEGCEYAERRRKDGFCSAIIRSLRPSNNYEGELKKKLEKLTEQGTKDWSDVPNATKWVEEQRGIEQEDENEDDA